MAVAPLDAGKIKIVLLGETQVGKTSILTRYVTGICPEDAQPTVGVAYHSKQVSIGGAERELHIWDTAGQEVYRTLMPMYYRNVGIAIVVFDVCDRQSYEAVEYWVGELRANCEDRLVVVLCGNKVDRDPDREVTSDEANSLATQLHALYVETSALSNTGIDRLFQVAVSSYVSTARQTQDEPIPMVLKQTHSKKKCC
jgi:small GTP-binding protein